MAILNNLIVKGDSRFIGEAAGDFVGTFNGFDLQMAAPETDHANHTGGSEGLISAQDKYDYNNLVARIAGYGVTTGTVSNNKCTAYSVTISGVTAANLVAGTTIFVKFHKTNNTNATINVSGTGAKNIYYCGSNVLSGYIFENSLMCLTYDGTAWNTVYSYNSNTTYTAGSLGFGYAICNTTSDVTDKVASCSGYTLTNGSLVAVNFAYGNTASNPLTLNINNTGAKTIVFNFGYDPSNNVSNTNDQIANNVLNFEVDDIILFMYETTTDGNGRYRYLNSLSGDSTIKGFYGSCLDAGSEVVKHATVGGNYRLAVGNTVSIKFTNDNTANNIKLAINAPGADTYSSWAKNIYYKGKQVPANMIKANNIYTFIYTGTVYEIISLADVHNPTIVTQSYASKVDITIRDADNYDADNPNANASVASIGVATSSVAGLMSPTHFSKLEGLQINSSFDASSGNLVTNSAIATYLQTNYDNKKGVANGFASLDENAKVPASQLPSYVDDVVEGYVCGNVFYSIKKIANHNTVIIAANTITDSSNNIIGTEAGSNYKWQSNGTIEGYVESSSNGTITGYAVREGQIENSSVKATTFYLSEAGEADKIYIDLDTNKTYRWSGSQFVEISQSLALGYTSSTAYPGNEGKATTDSFNLLKTYSNTNVYISPLGSDDDLSDGTPEHPFLSFNKVIEKFGHLTHINVYVDLGTEATSNFFGSQIYLYNWQSINFIGYAYDDSNSSVEEIQDGALDTSVSVLTAQFHINSCDKVYFKEIKFRDPSTLATNFDIGMYNYSDPFSGSIVYINHCQNVIFDNCYFEKLGTNNIEEAIYAADSKIKVYKCRFHNLSQAYKGVYNSEIYSYLNTGTSLSYLASLNDSKIESDPTSDFIRNTVNFTGTRGDYNYISLTDSSYTIKNVLQPIGGGTGQNTLPKSANVLNDSLPNIDSSLIPIADDELFISNGYHPSVTNEWIWGKRTMSDLWAYVKNKVELTPTSNVPYGVCSTAAATATKTVSVNGYDGTAASNTFKLSTGARVYVKFSVTNSATNPTLNVNGTGDKAIYYRGSAITANALASGRTYEFIYNGNQYEYVGDRDTDSTSPEKFGQGYAICTTAAGTPTKTATLENYELVNHGMVSVYFQYSVPANATLNINSKGAIPIVYGDTGAGKQNTATSSTGYIKGGSIATFIYNYVDSTHKYYRCISRDAVNAPEAISIDTASVGTAANQYARADHKHSLADVALTSSTASQTLSHNGKFTVISAITTNRAGQVTGITQKEFTLPSDSDTKSPEKFGQGYAICTTAADTTAKTATLTNYELVVNGTVSVYFQYDVPANATLSINSKAAKPITYGDSSSGNSNTAIAANMIKGGDIASFIYDGTYYRCIDRLPSSSDAYTTQVYPASWRENSSALTYTTIDKTAGTSTKYARADHKHTLAPIYPTVTTDFATIDDGNTIYVNNTTQNDSGQVIATSETTYTIRNNKVKNTPLDSTNTAKHYITATSNTAENTGFQKFSTGVYIEGESGNNFHADGTINGAVPYGVCSTAAGTAAKTVSVPGTFSLVTGARVIVKITNANTASNPTLNVNNTGAREMYFKNGANNFNLAGNNATLEFIYNGTQYEFVGGGLDVRVRHNLKNTTKFHITGTESSSTVTGEDDFDTGIYATTTAGQLNATTYKLNEAVTFTYNSTNECVDFVFS